MNHLQGKFVWYEHLSNDVGAARQFYEGLFGWHTEPMLVGEQRYAMILNGGDGIGGYDTATAGTPAQWRSYVSVTDVDLSYRAALAAGGVSLEAPHDVGPMGRSASFTDPTGAALALWCGAQGDPADVALAPDGTFCWNELMTADPKRALAFYEVVIGYSHTVMDMGPQGHYYLLSAGGEQRGGLMKSPMPEAPTMWQPYVKVADADACAAKATGLGAKLLVPPTDIPGVGRFAVLLDTTGASIAVIKLLAGAG
jgi:uncharacterized protein